MVRRCQDAKSKRMMTISKPLYISNDTSFQLTLIKIQKLQSLSIAYQMHEMNKMMIEFYYRNSFDMGYHNIQSLILSKIWFLYNPTFNLFEESFMSWYINRDAAFPDKGVESDNNDMEGCCCK